MPVQLQRVRNWESGHEKTLPESMPYASSNEPFALQLDGITSRDCGPAQNVAQPEFQDNRGM